jgi:hypothetical protein
MQLQCREKYIYENPGSTILYPQQISRWAFTRVSDPLHWGNILQGSVFCQSAISTGCLGLKSQHIGYGARVCKRLYSPGINSEESIPPAYEASTGRYEK